MTHETHDPLGQALLAYMAGQTDQGIIVNSSITEEDFIPVSHFFREEANMPEIEQQALKLCKARVLDAGAGAGSHALVLQQAGYAVTALDVSAGAVQVMRQRGLKHVIQEDIFSFEADEPFDTILLLMNGIGIAGTLEGLDMLLAHFKTLLKPTGQILLDSSDIIYMYEEEDGAVYIDLNAAYYGEVSYQMTYNDQQGEPFNWLFVDFATLQDHAEALGYNSEILFENEDSQYLARLTL